MQTTARQFQAAPRHLLVSKVFKLSEKPNYAVDIVGLLATLLAGVAPAGLQNDPIARFFQ